MAYLGCASQKFPYFVMSVTVWLLWENSNEIAVKADSVIGGYFEVVIANEVGNDVAQRRFA